MSNYYVFQSFLDWAFSKNFLHRLTQNLLKKKIPNFMFWVIFFFFFIFWNTKCMFQYNCHVIASLGSFKN